MIIFGGRRPLPGAVALLLTAGLLAAVGVGASAAPAIAAPVVPCTQTFAGTVGSISADTVNQTPADAPTAAGKDRRIDRARTNTSGRFRVKLGRRTGTFYASATTSLLAGAAECSSDASRKLTVRR